MKRIYHIGLDVHAKTIGIACVGPDGRLEFHSSCASFGDHAETLAAGTKPIA